MRLASLCLCLLVMLPRAAGAQGEIRPLKSSVRFPPPEVRIGQFRAAVRVRLHFDRRVIDSEKEVAPDDFVFRRARVAVEGRIYDDLEFEVDSDLRDPDRPWRDVILNYRRFEALEIQGGKFKVPFGRDQLTSVFGNSFVSRSLIGSQLTPGRDRGVMAHGSLAKHTVNYQAGWFKRDGDNVRFSEDLDANEFEEPPVDGSFAARVEVLPWEHTKSLAEHLAIGANMTVGDVGDGLFSMRGRTLGGFVFFDPVYVKGRRLRTGVDALWTPGPFSVVAEYNRLTDQRNGQGLGDVDLPDVISQGWYLAGTWVLTGEKKAGGVEPRHPLFQGGFGAVEVAARIEELRFGSAGGGTDEPFTNPRAANILQNRDRALTLGGSWYLNRFGRLIFNAVRESIQDPVRSPLLDRTSWWTGVLRLQFVM